MITLREALTRATGQLAAHPELRPTALPDAALLLMHALGIERPTLIAHPERPIDRDQQSSYQRLIERRLAFEPIQYITGEQEFYGLALRVTPAVLIPRPETELLVEAVLKHLASQAPDAPRELRMADVGTGSGAIALALAHALPQAQLTALDISAEALTVARENAATHHLQNVRFLLSDLLAAIQEEPPYDVIASNPPYIPSDEVLHPQVREHEPATALFSGPTGLEIYERLIPQADAMLKPGGLLALEIGYGQQAQLSALLAEWQDVRFLADLQGIPRTVLARRP